MPCLFPRQYGLYTVRRSVAVAQYPDLPKTFSRVLPRYVDCPQVAAFILFATFQLIMAIRNDTLQQHPLFSDSSSSGFGEGGLGGGPYFKFDGLAGRQGGV